MCNKNAEISGHPWLAAQSSLFISLFIPRRPNCSASSPHLYPQGVLGLVKCLPHSLLFPPPLVPNCANPTYLLSYVFLPASFPSHPHSPGFWTLFLSNEIASLTKPICNGANDFSSGYNKDWCALCVGVSTLLPLLSALS